MLRCKELLNFYPISRACYTRFGKVSTSPYLEGYLSKADERHARYMSGDVEFRTARIPPIAC